MNADDDLNDLDMCGGEISYRVSDLAGKKINAKLRRKIYSAAVRAAKLVNDLGEIRVALGLKERPEDYEHVPPGGRYES